MCPPSARFPPGDPRSNPEPLAQRENANVSGEIPRKINSSRGILFAIVTNFTMGRGNYNLSNFKDPPDRFPKFKLDSCGTRCISRPRSIRVRWFAYVILYIRGSTHYTPRFSELRTDLTSNLNSDLRCVYLALFDSNFGLFFFIIIGLPNAARSSILTLWQTNCVASLALYLHFSKINFYSKFLQNMCPKFLQTLSNTSIFFLTCSAAHVENFLFQNRNISSVLSTFKYK